MEFLDELPAGSNWFPSCCYIPNVRPFQHKPATFRDGQEANRIIFVSKWFEWGRKEPIKRKE